MTINISIQDVDQNLHPKITVLGVGGSGNNAVNNMISANLEGVDFLIANTDAQALQISKCPNKIQLGLKSTRGLGAGMRPDIGKQAAEEAIQDITEKLEGSHMLFVAAGMGGGTGTGAAPVIAKLAREKGILTVGVVTKPFHFEGSQRMKLAEKGIDELQQYVDTLLTIPNQNLFRIANEKTTFADAFKMADDVLYAGVRGVTDLMVQPGMINLDFSDIKTVMSEMGKAMMGTGEASGEGRAVAAAEAAIANPLIDDVSLKGARGLIINITGGKDITLYEVDEAANRIKKEIDENANIIYGTTCDERLEGLVRVSIVATGIDTANVTSAKPLESYVPISLNNEVYKEPVTNRKDVSLQNNELSEEIEQSKTYDSNVEMENTLELNKEEAMNSENLETPHSNNEENLETSNSNNEEQDNFSLEKDGETNLNELDSLESSNIEKNSSLENMNENELELEEEVPLVKENLPEASVRRLSLFDNDSPEQKEKMISDEERTEPKISNENDILAEDEVLENEEIDQKEFSPEESESAELDEEFNQETEEELLDIPTFLRRQAN